MIPTAFATPRLPPDAAVADPNPEWGGIHRVVKMFAAKQYEKGAAIGAPSRMTYRCTTRCAVEFSTLVEPVSDDGMPGERCPLCYPAEEAAA